MALVIKTLKYNPVFRPLWWLFSFPIGFGIYLFGILRKLSSTVEVRGEGSQFKGPAIYVNWHKYIPVLVYEHGNHGRAVLVSQAPYMEPIVKWCELVGLKTIRGASGENGNQALKLMKEFIEKGGSVFIAVDGPAGPSQVMKRGCVDLARETGVPIIPVSCSCENGHVMRRRWDKAFYSSYFDRIQIYYGPPLFIPEKCNDTDALKIATEALNQSSPPPSKGKAGEAV